MIELKNTTITPNTLYPSIRIAFNHKLPVTFEITTRAIFDYELMYVGSGCAHVVIENSTYKVNKGDMVLFKPGVEHSFTLESDADDNTPLPGVYLPHIHFDLVHRPSHQNIYTSFKPLSDFSKDETGMISPDVTGEEGLNIPSHIKFKDPRPGKNLLLRIISEKGRQTVGSDLKAKGLLLELLGVIKSSISPTSSQQLELNMHRLEAVYKYIEDNIDNPLSINKLADIAGLSKYYLTRLFKEAFGEPPLTTQRRLRFERARELLLYTDMPIANIAQEVGFSSIPSFTQTFRTLTGFSPLQYVQFYQKTMKVESHFFPASKN